ncbi:hypothetical protein [Capnocytophaga canimorsus]|uniref:hypothetical protein n=1 Tax=Capnocytophaga canimorsus TaxID=28188 RepID=UPI0018E2FF18|nr:hypothetical protein [Capnocytophaga canimorsus]
MKSKKVSLWRYFTRVKSLTEKPNILSIAVKSFAEKLNIPLTPVKTLTERQNTLFTVVNDNKNK